MEPGAELEQGGDPAPRGDAPLGRPEDPRDDLEERRLPRAVRPDQAERRALADVDVDVLEGPELLPTNPEPGHPLLERGRALLVPAELLADAVDLDGGRRH